MTHTQNCIVHVVDDDEELLGSIDWLLKSVPFNVKTYVSAQAFLLDATPQSAGCVLTDLRMPEMSGMELFKKIRKKDVNMPVIIMTAHGQTALAVDAMKKGVFDFIEKPFDDQKLIDTLNDALRTCMIHREESKQKQSVLDAYHCLSAREKQVCNLVAIGSTNKAISVQLNISEKTVEVHRSQVMSKMRAQSLPQLVGMLILAGIQNPKDYT